MREFYSDGQAVSGDAAVITIPPITLTFEDLARLQPWQFRDLWDKLGETLYLRAKANGSDPSTSSDAPKSEPQASKVPSEVPVEQRVERTVTPSAGAPSVETAGVGVEPLPATPADPAPAVFEVIEEADAPLPPVRLSLQDATPVASKAHGAPIDEAVPTHFYLCVDCGYEAAGPATLEAHGRTHVEVAPLPSRKTTSGFLSSNMTPEQEANWLAAMKSGVKVTDDGPAPIETAPQQDIPRSADAGDVCRWCAKQCGGVAGRKTHESYCEARPMAKPKEGEHVHRWHMDPPSGPIIRGTCDCGATREDPASPEPRVGTGAQPKPASVVTEAPRRPRPIVTCEDCGLSMSGTQALASHRRSAHKAVAS